MRMADMSYCIVAHAPHIKEKNWDQAPQFPRFGLIIVPRGDQPRAVHNASNPSACLLLHKRIDLTKTRSSQCADPTGKEFATEFQQAKVLKKLLKNIEKLLKNTEIMP